MPPSVPPALHRALRERLRPTIAMLVRDLVADEFQGEAHVAPATDVLLKRLGGMAPHLGGGMVALTLGFDAWCQLHGAPYSRLSAERRAQMLRQWQGLPGPLGNWAQFYEKMSVFAYWAIVEESEAVDDHA